MSGFSHVVGTVDIQSNLELITSVHIGSCDSWVVFPAVLVYHTQDHIVTYNHFAN